MQPILHLKKAASLVIAVLIYSPVLAQWTNTTGGIYYDKGSVGIGTTNPVGTLTLKGNSSPSGQVWLIFDAPPNSVEEIIFTDNGHWKWAFGRFAEAAGLLSDGIGFHSYGIGKTVLSLKDNGKIGIGTTTPASKLHLYDGTLMLDGPVNTERAILFRDNGADAWWFGRDDIANHGLQDGIGFWRSNTGTAFVLKDNGNVGIGTPTPTGKLQVQNGPLVLDGPLTSERVIQFKDNGANGWSLGRNNDVQDGIGFRRTNTATAFVIKDDSKIGIGTTNPIYKMDIYGDYIAVRENINSNIAFMRGDAGGVAMGTLSDSKISIGNAGDIDRLTITRDGLVGINSKNPTAVLHVTGTVRFQGIPSGTGRVLVLDADGNLKISNQTAATPLPKAPIDNSTEIQALKEESNLLKQEIMLLKEEMAALRKSGSIEIRNTGDKAYLRTNVPNPFKGSTTVDYYYPASARSAWLNITDMNGRLIKRYQLRNHVTPLTVTLEEKAADTGTYIYSLEVDGKKVDSKKMVLMR